MKPAPVFQLRCSQEKIPGNRRRDTFDAILFVLEPTRDSNLIQPDGPTVTCESTIHQQITALPNNHGALKLVCCIQFRLIFRVKNRKGFQRRIHKRQVKDSEVKGVVTTRIRDRDPPTQDHVVIISRATLDNSVVGKYAEQVISRASKHESAADAGPDASQCLVGGMHFNEVVSVTSIDDIEPATGVQDGDDIIPGFTLDGIDRPGSVLG